MPRSKGGTQGRGVKIKPVLPAVKRPLPEGVLGQPLVGKVFYLDVPSKILSEKFEKDIKDLGGTVESFLSKEISFLITSKKEAKCTSSLKHASSLSSPKPAQNSGSGSARPGSRRGGVQEGRSNKKPGKDDVSRGKSLLKKVIKEPEILTKNSILANALNWGVQIMHVDEAKLFLQTKVRLYLPPEKGKQPEAPSKPPVKPPIVPRKPKAQKLKKPYIKVEDSSGQYRPLHLVLPSFRSFQSTPSKLHPAVEKRAATTNKATEPKQGLNKTWHGQDAANHSHCTLREHKKPGYCECCLQKYEDIDVHLTSPQHKNYSQSPCYHEVDSLISMFDFDFVDWSLYKQAKRAVLIPTVTVEWKEKEIAERHQLITQKITALAKQIDAAQRTGCEAPLIAADCPVGLNPLGSICCPVQTSDNHAGVSDPYSIPPGTPAVLPYTDKTLTPAAERTTTYDEDTQSPIPTPRQATFGSSLAAMPIQECAPVPAVSIQECAIMPTTPIQEYAPIPAVSTQECATSIQECALMPTSPILECAPMPIQECASMPAVPIPECAPMPDDPIQQCAPVPSSPIQQCAPVPSSPIQHCASMPSSPIQQCASVPIVPLQHCASMPGTGSPSKKIKLEGAPVSVNLYSDPVDANYVTNRKPVVDFVPDCLEPIHRSKPWNVLHGQSPHSSPSKLHRKVKRLAHKARKEEEPCAASSCKVSVPVEDGELGSSRERLLLLFDTSEAQSEFCGFSCKSESLPPMAHGRGEAPPSRGDLVWCSFSTTSSSAETFQGF
ncbi:protein DBF4 homolog A [Mantella aurantiaca]